MYNWTEREQRLVKICFELAITLHTSGEYFKGKGIPYVAEWVAEQLNQCGYRNIPVGSSWGTLIEEETFKKIENAAIRDEGTSS